MSRETLCKITKESHEEKDPGMSSGTHLSIGHGLVIPGIERRESYERMDNDKVDAALTRYVGARAEVKGLTYEKGMDYVTYIGMKQGGF